MTTNTGISWTDHTWNPWQGCTRVSPGCANCYMFAEREGRFGIPSGTVVRSSRITFRKPLSKAWRSAPAKVFTSGLDKGGNRLNGRLIQEFP